VSAVLLGIALVAGCASNTGLGDFEGRGHVFGYLWCLGVKLDTGDAAGSSYAIAYWPPGYTAKRIPGSSPNGELVDSSGATVLKEGDTVDVHLHMVIATGDTPCGNTAVATVLDFAPVSSPAPLQVDPRTESGPRWTPGTASVRPLAHRGAKSHLLVHDVGAMCGFRAPPTLAAR